LMCFFSAGEGFLFCEYKVENIYSQTTNKGIIDC
ncbi:unnamed protein product, partial [marine sediment metagenome]